MKVIEEPQLAVKRKWPWLIDVFVYPLSVPGLVHLAVFFVVPFLIGFIYRNILSGGGPLAAVVSIGLYVLFIGYVFYYIAYCVVDSAKGGRRAPDISIYATPGKGELVSQLLCVVGAVAVCFWPVGVYYILTERVDRFFWLLSGYGIFFFPMALLRVLMFDSFDSLNPIVIVVSIYRTFLIYLGLVLFFCVPGGLVYVMISDTPQTQTLEQTLLYIFIFLDYLCGAGFVCRLMVFIYSAMVGAHLLGCFYWWHKDKLDWGL